MPSNKKRQFSRKIDQRLSNLTPVLKNANTQKQFENKTSQLHIHPAIKGIGIHLTENPAYVAPSGYISIYTDGSRIDKKVGSAFVVLSEQQQPLHQWQMQLSTENSVFQSEALAIHEAIRYLTNNKISKALIHTDSLSSMQATANSEHTSPQIAGIQKSLRENAHNHYVIKWIKAHTGIYGNELADGLAKDAATGNNITAVQIPWPTSYLKKTLRQIVCNKWQQEWTNSLTGRRTFYFKPKVDLQRLIASPLLVRYISGHGPFPQYYHRHAITSTDECICGEEGTADHYITACPLTEDHHIAIPITDRQAFCRHWTKIKLRKQTTYMEHQGNSKYLIIARTTNRQERRTDILLHTTASENITINDRNGATDDPIHSFQEEQNILADKEEDFLGGSFKGGVNKKKKGSKILNEKGQPTKARPLY
ncbi:hypothetical protein X975_05129, partial [Stegodyphus mimosarum]